MSRTGRTLEILWSKWSTGMCKFPPVCGHNRIYPTFRTFMSEASNVHHSVSYHISSPTFLVLTCTLLRCLVRAPCRTEEGQVSRTLLLNELTVYASTAPNRFIPSSYRPSCASIVQVAWQTYLSTVNFDPHSIPAISSETREMSASTTAKASQAVRGGGKGNEGMVMMTPATDTASVLPYPSLNRLSDDNRPLSGISYRRHMTTRYAYRPRDDMKELKNEKTNDQVASGDVDCPVVVPGRE